MSAGFFVTGTDTDIGKTWTTVALMRRFQGQGLKAVGMKPVAAGCDLRDGILQNRDAVLLREHASILLPYAQVNPYAFEPAISPHLASGGVEVSLQVVSDAFSQMARVADVVLVEGAGGWHSPLSPTLDNAGLAQRLALSVILVVGMRLGCINHARLTARAIAAAGLSCAGWIAVQLDAQMPGFNGNLGFLQGVLDLPLLGVLPYMQQADFEILSTNLSLPNWENFDLDQKY